MTIIIIIIDDRKVAHGWHPSIFDTRYRPEDKWERRGREHTAALLASMQQEEHLDRYRMFPNEQEVADTYGRAASIHS